MHSRHRRVRSIRYPARHLADMARRFAASRFAALVWWSSKSGSSRRKPKLPQPQLFVQLDDGTLFSTGLSQPASPLVPPGHLAIFLPRFIRPAYLVVFHPFPHAVDTYTLFTATTAISLVMRNMGRWTSSWIRKYAHPCNEYVHILICVHVCANKHTPIAEAVSVAICVFL